MKTFNSVSKLLWVLAISLLFSFACRKKGSGSGGRFADGADQAIEAFAGGDNALNQFNEAKRLEQLIADEAAARQAADAALQKQINELRTDLEAFKKEVRDEIARLDERDRQLAESITNLRSELTDMLNDMDTEIRAYVETETGRLDINRQSLAAKIEHELANAGS